jgi:hypothetical protein
LIYEIGNKENGMRESRRTENQQAAALPAFLRITKSQAAYEIQASPMVKLPEKASRRVSGATRIGVGP